MSDVRLGRPRVVDHGEFLAYCLKYGPHISGVPAHLVAGDLHISVSTVKRLSRELRAFLNWSNGQYEVWSRERRALCRARWNEERAMGNPAPDSTGLWGDEVYA
jgi:hypothetical protein